jgi:hypothetical protein
VTPEYETERLKACPFCGANPHHGLGKVEYCQLHGDPFQRFSVWCPSGCAKKTAADRERAIASWNARDDAGHAAGRAGGWLPIESAPRGEWVLCIDFDNDAPFDYYAGRHVFSGYVDEDGKESYWEAACGQYVTNSPEPTHWMPLPAPPAIEGISE